METSTPGIALMHYNEATPAINEPLAPDDHGYYGTHPAVIPDIGTGRYPSWTAAVFTGTATESCLWRPMLRRATQQPTSRLQRPNMLSSIFIRVQYNSESNAKGAQRGGCDETMHQLIRQNTHTHNYTHAQGGWRGGGGVSKGLRWKEGDQREDEREHGEERSNT